MQVEIETPLYLKRVFGGTGMELCSVPGCTLYRVPHYKDGRIDSYYLLCHGHRIQSRNKYLGIESSTLDGRRRYVFPEHPKCRAKNCGLHCTYKISKLTGKPIFGNYCYFHKEKRNRLREHIQQSADLSLKLPDLVSKEIYDLKEKCSEAGCKKPVHYSISRYGRLMLYTRCKKHYLLSLRNLPADTIKEDPACYKRNKCVADGCQSYQASKGLYRGRQRYDQYCEKHRRSLLRTEKEGRRYRAKEMKNECEICNWKGPCDRHRIVNGKDGGKYTKENVITVCPNCHRLLHRGLLKWPP